MYAWATVHAGRRRIRRLADSDPGLVLTLAVQKTVEPSDQPCTPAQVLRELEARGVEIGFKAEAVTQAIAQPGNPVLVAEGRAPRAGQPACLWTVVHGMVGGVPEGTGQRRAAPSREASGRPGTNAG